MRISLKADPQSKSEFDRLTKRWEQVGRHLEAPVREIAGDALRSIFAQHFDQEGPGWYDLAKRTVKEREEAGFGGKHPILVRTGALRNSIIDRNHPLHIEGIERGSSSLFTLALGTADDRFDLLHYGDDVTTPARPMMVIEGYDHPLLEGALEACVLDALAIARF